MIAKVDRLRAALAGEVADRPPVALWRHFPVDDQSVESFVDAVLSFQRDFDFDFIKVTPASSYSVRDWGVADEWRGSTEGTRQTVRHPVVDPPAWLRLQPLDVRAGVLGAHLRALAAILTARHGKAPVLPTVFSPLAQARKLAGAETLKRHLQTDPDLVVAGLERITATTLDFVRAVVELGVEGIFYAIQHASEDHFDRAGYDRFGLPFDLRILEAAQGLWLNLLHLHGQRVFFDLARELPIAVVNWHDRETPPEIGEGRHRSGRAVCGGIARESTLLLGDPEAVRSEARRAWQATGGGRGLILGTGCVAPIHAPRGNLQAVRFAFEELPGSR